jgi:Ohr subfamily peroxiredoxin
MAHISQKLYTTTVTVSGGRDGHAVSDDGVLDVQLRRPKLKGVNEGTNPEQLFAAAWGGCLQSALMAVARKAGAEALAAAAACVVTVEIAQGPDDLGGYSLAAWITIDIPDLGREQAEELLHAAHALCPYSKATRGNIDVDLRLGAHN